MKENFSQLGNGDKEESSEISGEKICLAKEVLLQGGLEQARMDLVKNFIMIKVKKSSGPDMKALLSNLEKMLIEYALLVSLGNQRRASRLLGTKPTCLNEKIRKYNIPKFESAGSMDHIEKFEQVLGFLAD